MLYTRSKYFVHTYILDSRDTCHVPPRLMTQSKRLSIICILLTYVYRLTLEYYEPDLVRGKSESEHLPVDDIMLTFKYRYEYSYSVFAFRRRQTPV